MAVLISTTPRLTYLRLKSQDITNESSRECLRVAIRTALPPEMRAVNNDSALYIYARKYLLSLSFKYSCFIASHHFIHFLLKWFSHCPPTHALFQRTLPSNALFRRLSSAFFGFNCSDGISIVLHNRIFLFRIRNSFLSSPDFFFDHRQNFSTVTILRPTSSPPRLTLLPLSIIH